MESFNSKWNILIYLNNVFNISFNFTMENIKNPFTKTIFETNQKISTLRDFNNNIKYNY